MLFYGQSHRMISHSPIAQFVEENLFFSGARFTADTSTFCYMLLTYIMYESDNRWMWLGFGVVSIYRAFKCSQTNKNLEKVLFL
jgi:hypothetical protein